MTGIFQLPVTVQFGCSTLEVLMVFALPGVKFDLELIKKYDTPAPRYTSYPPATQLAEGFTASDYQSAIAASNQRQSPLSLYFHIPFCQSSCYFCGCNTVISNNKNIAKPYLEHLVREIKNTSSLIDPSRKVLQVHWGGGTPNYLERNQVEFLWKNIIHHFNIDPQAEISIEINPVTLIKTTFSFCVILASIGLVLAFKILIPRCK